MSTPTYYFFFSENELRRNKLEELAQKELFESEREVLFNEIHKENEDAMFHLKGLKFLKFTHKKIKFMYEPIKVVTVVSRKVKFFCSLKYLEDYGYWIVKRDSFPSDLKPKIYSLFYAGSFFAVDDESLPIVIQKIHKWLQMWSKKEEMFRLEKMMVSLNNLRNL